MYVAHAETAEPVGSDDISRMFEHHNVRAVRHWDGGAVANATGYGVQEKTSLDQEKIDAERDVAAMVRNGAGASHLSLERGNVGPVDGEGPVGIVRGDGVINDEVAVEDGPELLLVGLPQHVVELSGEIGLLDLPVGEHLFVLCYGLQERISVIIGRR